MSLFGALVAVVEALNGLGVAFTSNPSSTQSTQELGSKLTKASLAFQLAVIVVCVMLAGLFYRKCVREGVRSKRQRPAHHTLFKHVLDPRPLYLSLGRASGQRGTRYR